MEETYEALKTFKVLGIEKNHGIKTSSCASVGDTLKSTSSALKDIYHALRVNSILKCELNTAAFQVLKNFLPLSTIYVRSCHCLMRRCIVLILMFSFHRELSLDLRPLYMVPVRLWIFTIPLED